MLIIWKYVLWGIWQTQQYNCLQDHLCNLGIQLSAVRSSFSSLFEILKEHKKGQRLSGISSFVSVVIVHVGLPSVLSIPLYQAVYVM
jgi:hypothetical protein